MWRYTQDLPPANDATIIAVDLGYSAKRASCGIAIPSLTESRNVQFGRAIDLVAECVPTLRHPIVVLEGALSTRHTETGNPAIRGKFEQGRGWYWGPGAVSVIAGQRFLQKLATALPDRGPPIPIAEAFLSNKTTATCHAADASEIAFKFWRTHPEPLDGNCAPILATIDGPPEVRVFKLDD